MKNKNKHERIIKAAIKVFAQKGFYNSRISDVAKEASVADGTVYLYFKNKDDILINLFEEEMDRLLKSAREQIKDVTDPLDKLRRFVSWHFQMLESNHELFEVLMVELRQSNKFMKEYKNVKFLEMLQISANIIREGQLQGKIRKELSPRIIKRMLYGAIDEITTSWLLSKGQNYDLQEVAKEVANVFIKGLET